MILISSLFATAAAQPPVLEERCIGVGVVTTFSGDFGIRPVVSLRWQASPKWVLEPSIGAYTETLSSYSDYPDVIESELGLGLTARRVLASKESVHLVGQAGLTTGFINVSYGGPNDLQSRKRSDGSVHTGLGVEWTPKGPLAIGADLVTPLASISRRSSDVDPSTRIEVGLSPQVRVSTHLYF